MNNLQSKLRASTAVVSRARTC